MNGEKNSPSPESVNRCPKCQAPLPADAPQGLCAKCLLEAASTPTEAGHGQNVPVDLEVVRRAFPNLEILDVQGCGGMGVVYKARQPKLDRFVALKLLSQSLASDPSFAERFSREARVLARLNHPNIVTVYDYGEAGGFYYLLMEYVDGINLRQALQGGRFTPQQALALVPKICEALQFAHEEGILHRDIKPENILLDSRGRVKIADFGIAKLLGEKVKQTTLTASGAALGTPQYMAPEQLEHRGDIDQRADIYSLGVVFYEMLTGELPIGRFAPPSAKTPMDPRVDEVVLRTLEKEREKRFASAGEVKTKVEQITGEAERGQPAMPSSTQGQAGPTPAPLKRARCYFSTPERMRNCFSWLGANIFICQGELIMEPEKLTFVSQWDIPETIPLRDIEDLSIGQFSMWQSRWFMTQEQLNYLAITFRKGGEWRTYHFTPRSPRDSIAQDINDWFEAIKEAAAKLSGLVPRTSVPAAVSVSGEKAWKKKVRPAGIVLALLWLAMLGSAHNSAPHSVFLALWSINLFCVAWFVAIWIRANNALKRGDLDDVTLERPPHESQSQGSGGTVVMPASAGGGGSKRPPRKRNLFGCFALVLLVFLLTCGLGLFWYLSLDKVHYKQPPGLAENKLVLEEARIKSNERLPGLQVFRWKYSIPPNHIAMFLFIMPSNGVLTAPNEVLSRWHAAPGKKPAEGTIQWACQEGVMLSPELAGQERWDVKMEPADHVGASGTTASFWTRGMLQGPIRTHSKRITVAPPKEGEELLAFGEKTNVVMVAVLKKASDGWTTGKGDFGTWPDFMKRLKDGTLIERVNEVHK